VTGAYLGAGRGRVKGGGGRLGPPSGGAIVGGWQITTANTGYGAYVRASLGRPQTLADLTVVAGTHFLTDFTGGSGGSPGNNVVVEGYHFTGDVVFDQPYITMRGCLLDNPTTNFRLGASQVGARLEYCEVASLTVGAECMHFDSWSAHRCNFGGCSDGAKINGSVDITECYVRVKMAGPDDHNDTLQNVGGNGVVNIRKSNLSVNPVGGLITGGTGGPNAVVMSADLAVASVFSLNVEDCLLDGTNSVETLRFYDGGLTTNIVYRAAGNRFVRSASAPLGRGASNTTPTGQITWTGNVWADNFAPIPLV
jgi:hypothetical protein